jgi:hypothetical protein
VVSGWDAVVITCEADAMGNDEEVAHCLFLAFCLVPPHSILKISIENPTLSIYTNYSFIKCLFYNSSSSTIRSEHTTWQSVSTSNRKPLSGLPVNGESLLDAKAALSMI